MYLYVLFMLCLVVSIYYIFRSASYFERDSIDHVAIGYVMCKLFIQPFIHSGLVSINRLMREKILLKNII